MLRKEFYLKNPDETILQGFPLADLGLSYGEHENVPSTPCPVKTEASSFFTISLAFLDRFS